MKLSDHLILAFVLVGCGVVGGVLLCMGGLAW